MILAFFKAHCLVSTQNEAAALLVLPNNLVMARSCLLAEAAQTKRQAADAQAPIVCELLLAVFLTGIVLVPST